MAWVEFTHVHTSCFKKAHTTIDSVRGYLYGHRLNLSIKYDLLICPFLIADIRFCRKVFSFIWFVVDFYENQLLYTLQILQNSFLFFNKIRWLRNYLNSFNQNGFLSPQINPLKNNECFEPFFFFISPTICQNPRNLDIIFVHV